MKIGRKAVWLLGAAAATVGMGGEARADCSTSTPPGGTTTLECSTDTTTTNSTNTNPNNPSTSDREQAFETDIVGRIEAGVTIDGFGLEVEAIGTNSISFEHNGHATSSAAGDLGDFEQLGEAISLNGNGGLITYTGNGSAAGSPNDEFGVGVAIESNDGAVNVGSAATPITGEFSGRFAGFDIFTLGVDADVTAFFDGGTFTSPDDSLGSGLTIAGSGNVDVTTTGGTVFATDFGGIEIAIFGSAAAARNATLTTDARIGTADDRVFSAVSSSNFTTGTIDIALTDGGSLFALRDGILAVSGGDVNITTAAGTTIDVEAEVAEGLARGIFASNRDTSPDSAGITLDLSGSIAARAGPAGEAVGVFARGRNGPIDITVRQGATVFGTDTGLLVTRFEGGTATADILVLGTVQGAVAADFIGTLRVGNGGTAGTLIGNVIDNGTLVFNRSDQVIFTGTISGAGALRQAGAGALILTRNNSFTGGTTITQGTLQVGNGGTTGSIVGNVANNGILIFDRSNSLTFGGVISGSGSVRQNGSGTLILTGNSTYTGTTTVTAGTLRLGNGGTSGIVAGNIVDNSNLVFNRSDNVTYGGVISGTGTVRQSGPGVLTLTGASTYTGGTTVEAGSLIVNGSIVGNTLVNADTLLGGTGTIGSATFNGTVAPGSGGVGTLNASGDVTFAAGSTFQVQVDPSGAADRMLVGGSATLQGGTVQALFLGTEDNKCGDPIQSAILTAQGGVTGTFAGVTSNFAFLTPSLSYDANNVILTLTRNAATFAQGGTTANQIEAADATEALGCGNALFNAAVLLTGAEVDTAFDQISGEIHASARGALFDDSRFVREAVLAPGRERRGGWAWGYGSWGEIEADGNAADLDRDGHGLFAGFDVPLGAAWSVGVAGGYSRADFEVDARASEADLRSWHLAARIGGRFGGFRLDAGGAFAWHRIETDRTIAFTGFTDSASARYDADTTQIFARAGYEIPLGSVVVEPFADAAWVRVETDAFEEDGGAAALTGADGSDSATFTTLGIRGTAGTGPFSVAATLGWRHAFGLDPSETGLAFNGGTGPDFTVVGAAVAEDALLAELGVEISLGGSARLGLAYSGLIGDRSDDHGARATLNVPF